MNLHSSRAVLLAGLLPVVASPVNASCGATFCGLNTLWETQQVWTEAGTRLDLRFEYIDQDQPRAGRDKVGVGEIHRHHDEVRTLNQNWVLALDHSFGPTWGFTLQLPYVDRQHEHAHHHGGTVISEQWDFANIGDLRLTGRYQFPRKPDAAGAWGTLFGLKLPTGETDVANADGDVAERSLQPGTGTTDVIGALYYNTVFLLADRPTSAFVQGQIQAPVNEDEGYKPGEQYALDIGLGYPLAAHWTGMLQANLQIKGRDAGAEAEPQDTGGTFAWLSPGLSYAVSRNARVYTFVQLPVYQRVNGVQLTADWTALAGVSWRF